MAAKNLHDKPFREETLLKLEIFEAYLQAWLPTFIMQPYITEINIIDFFAGPGKDIDGKSGSPLLFIKKIESFYEMLQQKKTRINLYLNEYANEKFRQLENNIKDWQLGQPKIAHYLKIHLFSDDFRIIFNKLKPVFQRRQPNLLYLDQNGLKFFSNDIIEEITRLHKTDYLVFMSSTYAKRFAGTNAFQKYLNLNPNYFMNIPMSRIHEALVAKLQLRIKLDSSHKLYPFSIKKGNNIYGLIFGAESLRAVEKFLSIVWKISPRNGSANYDIEDEMQSDLFGNNLTKIEKFQKNLEDSILRNEIQDTKQIFEFTMNSGHLPEHARACLRSMKKAGKIDYQGQIAISWTSYHEEKLKKWKLTAK